MILKTYTGEPLKLQREAEVTVCYKGQTVKLPLLVVKGDGPSLLGCNWLTKINLDWHENQIYLHSTWELLQKYRTFLSDQLGTMVGVQEKLAVKPDVKPKFVEHKLHCMHSQMQLRKISCAYSN